MYLVMIVILMINNNQLVLLKKVNTLQHGFTRLTSYFSKSSSSSSSIDTDTKVATKVATTNVNDGQDEFEEAYQPYILWIDSLSKYRKSRKGYIIRYIEEYLQDQYQVQYQQFKSFRNSFEVINVPTTKQTNGFDCGPHTIYNIYKFVMNISEFLKENHISKWYSFHNANLRDIFSKIIYQRIQKYEEEQQIKKNQNQTSQ